MQAIKKLLGSAFARDAISLSLGTGFAQAILLGAMPVLSRLYTPEDFGVFALYMAIATTLSFVATLRFENAIILPRETPDALGIVALIFALSTVSSLVLLALAFFFNEEITALLGAPRIGPWLYFIPLTVFLRATFSAMRYWLLRRRKFKAIAVGVASQSTLFGIGSIFIGASRSPGSASPEGGLIYGQIIGDAVYAGIGLRQLRLRDWIILKAARYKTLAALLHKYRALALTLTGTHGIAMLHSKLPIFVISSVFGTAQVGLFAFAQRIVAAPALLIAGAIEDVFKQRASVQWQKNGRFDQLVIKTVIATSSIALLPYAVAIFFLPDLFSVIFGEQWRIAGEYGSILMIGGYFSFALTPIQAGTIIVGAYRFMFVWHLLRLLLKVIAAVFAVLGYIDIYAFLVCIIVIRIFLYVLDFVYIYLVSTGEKKYVF